MPERADSFEDLANRILRGGGWNHALVLHKTVAPIHSIPVQDAIERVEKGIVADLAEDTLRRCCLA
jgi:hypothetical protein